MCIHACVKWNVVLAEIEGDIGDDIGDDVEVEHRNEEDDVEDEIVVVRPGRSEDDVGMDMRNLSP
jgi:hypothetical protein